MKTQESVTHFKDTYKLNIRRLFKEYLTPGVPEDKIICLDKVLDGKFFVTMKSQIYQQRIFWVKSKVNGLESTVFEVKVNGRNDREWKIMLETGSKDSWDRPL